MPTFEHRILPVSKLFDSSVVLQKLVFHGGTRVHAQMSKSTIRSLSSKVFEIVAWSCPSKVRRKVDVDSRDGK